MAAGDLAGEAFAVIELGLPAALFGALAGLVVGLLLIAGRHVQH